MVAKKGRAKPEYLKFKNPADVLSYIQRLINRIRREDAELEQLGKISFLLNVWNGVFKTQVDYLEAQKLRVQIDALEKALKEKEKGKDGKKA